MMRSLSILSAALFLLSAARASAVPIPCDDPSLAPCPGFPVVALPPPVSAIERPRWRPALSLAVVSGVGAHSVLLGSSSGPAPYLGGELRVLWQKQGSGIGLGFRVAGSSSLQAQGSWTRIMNDDLHGELRLLGFEAGFVFSVSWFWLSGGLGLMQVQDLRPESSDSFTIPDVSLASGLDIPLGDHLAIRLYVSAATLLFTGRINGGGGLVVRF